MTPGGGAWVRTDTRAALPVVPVVRSVQTEARTALPAVRTVTRTALLWSGPIPVPLSLWSGPRPVPLSCGPDRQSYRSPCECLCVCVRAQRRLYPATIRSIVRAGEISENSEREPATDGGEVKPQ